MRNSRGESLDCFASNMGNSNALFAEIMGVILAIKAAFDRNWQIFRYDSKLATLPVKSPLIVPWQLRNKWLNCKIKMNIVNCFISHIYKEGNHCGDKLVSIGLSLNEFTWWNTTPG